MKRKTRAYVTVSGLGGILAGVGLLTGYSGQVTSAEPAAPVAAEAKVTPLFSKDLKEFPGKEGSMITVEYPPGSVDPVHRHNAHAFVYVLEGSIVMQLKGEKEVTLKPGDTFYEGPDDVHTVGRNASKTEPAKFVVFLVKNKGAPVLVPEK
jgi:quercetin dioxygenase-like cupin family protein